MKITLTNAFGLGLVVASFLLAALLYGDLPDPVPIHWSANHDALFAVPKPWGALLCALYMTGAYGFWMLLPKVLPSDSGTEKFQRVFDIVAAANMAFLFVVGAYPMLLAVGIEIPARVFAVGASLTLMITGNFLGKVTRNSLFGVRTPWTAASDEVWLRTHRMTAKLAFAVGALGLVWTVAGGDLMPLLLAILTVFTIPHAYSYWLYRRLHERSSERS